MLLEHETIGKEALLSMKQTCFDYSHKSNQSRLRERYLFLGVPGEEGIVGVECNTSGGFIEIRRAGLSEAISWLNQT